MRRTKEEAEQTRRQIINAAIKVMNKKGIASTRFEDIAKEAKVTRGAIYHYFKSKNEILYTIHATRKKLFHSVIEKYRDKDIDPVSSLKKGFAELFERFESDPHFRAVEELIIKVEFASLIKQDKKLSARIEQDRDEVINRMYEVIKEGQKNNSIRNDIEVEKLGLIMMGFYVGTTVLWCMKIKNFSLKENADDFINVLLHGIAKQ